MPNLQNWKKYCECSSLAGMQYFVTGPVLHKIFWIMVFLSSTSYATYMCVYNIIKWIEYPDRITMTKVGVNQLQFPAVTVCPIGGTPWISYQNIMNQINVDDTVKSALQQTLLMARALALGALTLHYTTVDLMYTELKDVEPKETEANYRTYFPEGDFYEDWVFKVDKLYMECNRSDPASFCVFYDNVTKALDDIFSTSDYWIWLFTLENINQWEFKSLEAADTFYNLATGLFLEKLDEEAKAFKEGDGKKTPLVIMTEYVDFLTNEGFAAGIQDWKIVYDKSAEMEEMDMEPSAKFVDCRDRPIFRSTNRSDSIYKNAEEFSDKYLGAVKTVVSNLTQRQVTKKFKNYKDIQQLLSDHSDLRSIAYSNEKWLFWYKHIQTSFESASRNIDGFVSENEALAKSIEGETTNNNSDSVIKSLASAILSDIEFVEEGWKVLRYDDNLSPFETDCMDLEQTCFKQYDVYSSYCTKCRCEKILKLKIFKLYRIFHTDMGQIPHVNYLGEVLSWFFTSHLMANHHLSPSVDFPATNENFTKIVGWNHSVWKNISEEVLKFDSSIFYGLNLTGGTDMKMALFDFLIMMTTEPIHLDHAYDFPRMTSIPKAMRDEIFAIYNYTTNLTSSSHQKIFPVHFRNISESGFTLAEICQNKSQTILGEYCRYTEDTFGQLSLEILMTLLKYSEYPLHEDDFYFPYEPPDDVNITLKNQSDHSIPHQSYVPFCQYGEGSDIYWNTPDMSYDDFKAGSTEESYAEEWEVEKGEVYRFPACRQFVPTPSDVRLCHTFNGMHLKDILKAPEWISTFHTVFNISSDPKDKKKIFNVTATGKESGLTFIVDTMQSMAIAKEERMTHKIDKNQFWLKIHNAGDIPRLTNEELATWHLIKPEKSRVITNVEISFKGEFSQGTTDFHNIPIEGRKCLYPDEGHLEMFNYYSYTNCMTECTWKEAHRVCGCKPWYIPAKKGEKVCFFLGSQCFDDIIHELGMLEKKRKSFLQCDCPTNCIENDYSMMVLPQDNHEEVINVCDTIKDECNELEAHWSTAYISTRENSLRKATRWHNLGSYVKDQKFKLRPNETFLESAVSYQIPYKSDQMQKRQENMFIVTLYLDTETKKIAMSERDVIMSTDDQIAWLGGTVGGFNGFCIISGVEILYWLLMIIFGRKEPSVASDDSEENLAECKGCSKRIEVVEKELKDLKGMLKEMKADTINYSPDKPASEAFDMLFDQ